MTSLEIPHVHVAEMASDSKRARQARKSSRRCNAEARKIRERKKASQLQYQTTQSAHLQSCFREFQLKISTVTRIPDSKRFDALKRATQLCCPVGEQAGIFTLLALQHLRRKQFSSNTIVSCILAAKLPLPDLGTPKGLEFVRQLNDMARTSDKIIRKMNSLYANIAATVPCKSSRNTSFRDLGLRMLYRAIWENALQSRPQGNNFEALTVHTLLDLASKFSNPQIGVYLRRIFNGRLHMCDQIEHLMRSHGGRHRRVAVGAPVLDCIPRTLLITCISSVPRSLFDEAKDRNKSQKYRHLENWLRLLRVLDSRIATAPENTNLSTLAFRSLAAQGINLSDIGRYPMSLKPQFLVEALLNWIPYQKSMREVPRERVDDFVRLYRMSLRKDVQSNVTRNEMLARLLARMHQWGLPNHEMANVIIRTVCQHKGIRTVLDILWRLKHKGVGLSDTEFLYALLVRLLAPLRQPTYILTPDDAATFDACLSIQALGLEVHKSKYGVNEALDSSQSRLQFQRIIGFARDAHLLPLAYKNMSLDLLMDIRAELIHQIAYQISLDRTRSIPQNWRSAHYLLKYLRQYQLPIRPLFTRAVVRICIIQPLSENRFVSSRRLTWVCQLVAQVEGVDVARRIEDIFWEWRGSLIVHAKRSLHANGGTGKAHVNIMKRIGLI